MKLLFQNCEHHLQALLKDDECPASAIKLLGEPLIVRNISMVEKNQGITKVLIPEDFHEATKLVEQTFPYLDIEEYPEENHAKSKVNILGNEYLEIPLNSVVFQSKIYCCIEPLIYPWDFLMISQKVLHDEVTNKIISKDASISETSIIKGPCIIEDGASIDDFCKIVGPTYIGKDSFIGMSSLVRNCIFGKNTRIGFNCEIGKTYFAGDCKIAHQNVILDSIIGKDTWFGGYSGTANVLLTRKNVKYLIGNDLVDTGIDHFGAVIGNGSTIGASVIILPGRQVPSNSIIQAGTIYGKV